MRSWSPWIRWWSRWVLSSPSRIMASVGKYTMPWIIDRAISALLLTNSWPGLKGHIILKNISANMAASIQLHLCSLWGALVSLLPCDKWSSIPSDSNERGKIYSNNRLSYTVSDRKYLSVTEETLFPPLLPLLPAPKMWLHFMTKSKREARSNGEDMQPSQMNHGKELFGSQG